MSKEDNKAVILPEFVQVILDMSGKDLTAYEPRQPLDENARVIRDMTPFEKACYARVKSLHRLASEAIEAGASVTSEGVQGIIREREMVDTILKFSLAQNRGENGPMSFNLHKGWKIVNDDTCDCPDCQARRAGISSSSKAEGMIVVEIDMVRGRPREPKKGLLARILGR